MTVSGNLQDMALTTLISVNCTEHNQGRLRLQRGQQEAFIYFDAGQIVHITLGNQKGEEVIYELLTWDDGLFELEMDVPPPARTVSTTWSELVLEGMRLIDEGTLELEADVEEASWTIDQVDQEEVSEMADKKRSEMLADTLSDLLAASVDIEGAVIVGIDGLVMASNLPKGVDEARVGASAAALLGLSKRTTPTLGRGNFTQGLVQGDSGNIIVVSAGERAVFVGLTPKSVNLGMVFLEAQDAAAAIAGAL